jgi:hypothetical protein
MSIVAIIPVADMLAANSALEALGFGPNNFSVPCYSGGGASHAALHCWNVAGFADAVKAIAGVAWEESDGDPMTRTAALIASKSAKWGAQAPDLPTTGNALANTLYRWTDGSLWWCIQTFSRSTFNAPPATYPALIRIVREPGTAAEWTQPIDQYDAYRLVNVFTGKPDEWTHNGKTWYVTQGDGSGNNVWEPGVFGWTEKS